MREYQKNEHSIGLILDYLMKRKEVSRPTYVGCRPITLGTKETSYSLSLSPCGVSNV